MLRNQLEGDPESNEKVHDKIGLHSQVESDVIRQSSDGHGGVHEGIGYKSIMYLSV